MLTLDGNTLVTTDWHFGLNGNSVNKLAILCKIVKQLAEVIEKKDISTLLFCGDLFHSRASLDSKTINVALKCVNVLASKCKIVFILGNHDIYQKSSTEINSVNIFRSIKNVTIVDNAAEAEMNGSKILLVPWLADLTSFKKSQYEMMFGHFEINSKYLVQSYINDNKNASQTSSSYKADVLDDPLLKSAKKDEVNDSVGEFVELVREGGYVFAGHIHSHKEFNSRKRHFIFIGSPYQQNLGEKNSVDGYYIIDSKNSIKFFELDSIPKHVDFRVSEAKDGGYDFSALKGMIVHKIYDVEIDQATDAKISKHIAAAKPFEELLPDYSIAVSEEGEDQVVSESIELIKKSKLQYIRNYIDQMEKDKDIDSDKLYTMMEDYYRKAVGE